MKIQELMEAIKGWKHAHGDLMKLRAQKSAQSHTAKLVSVKKDGTESRMHDATSTYATEAEARAKHAYIVKLNPTRNIRHNLYVDDKFVEMLTPEHLTEVSHKVGVAAQKALKTSTVDADMQQRMMHKWQELTDQEQKIQSLPDAHTGKYAKQLMNISRQKIKVATQGKLNAQGKPMMEDATSGATGAASVASMANPFGVIMRRPSLFGYTPAPKRKSRKKRKSSSSS